MMTLRRVPACVSQRFAVILTRFRDAFKPGQGQGASTGMWYAALRGEAMRCGTCISGHLQDSLLLLLEFLIGQNAGLPQLSQQPELG